MLESVVRTKNKESDNLYVKGRILPYSDEMSYCLD